MTMQLHPALRIFPIVVLLTALAAPAPSARADPVGTVTLDTSGLGGGDFELAFVLTDGSGVDDGSGVGDASTVVTAGNFSFGAGGRPGLVDPLLSTGGVSGDFVGGLSLTDSAFFNVLAAFFTAGDLLAFDFAASHGPNAGPTPDQFSLVLLQADGTPVPTADPSGANLLLVLDLGVPNPTFLVYASELTPPPVFVAAIAVAEPASLALLAMGLAAMLMTSRSRGARRLARGWC